MDDDTLKAVLSQVPTWKVKQMLKEVNRTRFKNLGRYPSEEAFKLEGIYTGTKDWMTLDEAVEIRDKSFPNFGLVQEINGRWVKLIED